MFSGNCASLEKCFRFSGAADVRRRNQTAWFTFQKANRAHLNCRNCGKSRNVFKKKIALRFPTLSVTLLRQSSRARNARGSSRSAETVQLVRSLDRGDMSVRWCRKVFSAPGLMPSITRLSLWNPLLHLAHVCQFLLTRSLPRYSERDSRRVLGIWKRLTKTKPWWPCSPVAIASCQVQQCL